MPNYTRISLFEIYVINAILHTKHQKVQRLSTSLLKAYANVAFLPAHFIRSQNSGRQRILYSFTSSTLTWIGLFIIILWVLLFSLVFHSIFRNSFCLHNHLPPPPPYPCAPFHFSSQTLFARLLPFQCLHITAINKNFHFAQKYYRESRMWSASILLYEVKIHSSLNWQQY